MYYKGVLIINSGPFFSLKTSKRYGVKRFYADVSMTAKPFFQHYGFAVVRQQQKEVRGVVLTNFLMEKR